MIKNITSIILLLGSVSSEIVSQYALLIPKVPEASAKYYSNSYSGGGSGYNPGVTGGSGYNSGSIGGSGIGQREIKDNEVETSAECFDNC